MTRRGSLGWFGGVLALMAVGAAGCATLGGFGLPGGNRVATGGERLKANDTAGAVAQFDAAVRDQPGAPVVYLSIAAVCQRAGRYDLMARYAEQGLDAVPKANKEERARLAVVAAAGHLQAGRASQALALARQAYELAPDSDEVLNNLAYAYAESPDVATQVGRANLQRARGMAMQAVKLASEGQRGDEVLGTYLDTLGWVDYRLGMYDSALDALTRAADKVPGEAVVLYHLGKAYQAKDRTADARTALLRAVQADPNLGPARAALEEIGPAPRGAIEDRPDINPLSGTPPTVGQPSMRALDAPTDR